VLQNFLFGRANATDRLSASAAISPRRWPTGRPRRRKSSGSTYRVTDLDDRQHRQLAGAAPLIKANFNPDGPRDPHGR
jgi:hypothetical protein